MQSLLFESPPDVDEVIDLLGRSENVFLKFLAPNDLGLTGSHQAGIYLPRDVWPFFLEEPGQKGENLDADVSLDWGQGRRTLSSFKWYGESKLEYRLTRIREFFRDQEERYVGSLFILIDAAEGLQARVLEAEDDIEAILSFLGITPNETNRLLRFDLDERLLPYCERLAQELGQNFPDTDTLSSRAQQVGREIYGMTLQSVSENPDRAILQLIEIEYALFRYMERQVYGAMLERPFQNVEELLRLAIEINNRRKSRAGRSLENHLRFLFQFLRLPHEFDARSEDRKKPDFLFPDIAAYNDPGYDEARLFFLGAKTTCKDRWRQVLNEADRIQVKHLFTLQQGITTAQINEMREAGVVLVLPAEYHHFIKEEDRTGLYSLKDFVDLIRNTLGQVADLFEQNDA